MFDPQKRHLLLLTHLSSWISAVENELSLTRTTITFCAFRKFQCDQLLEPFACFIYCTTIFCCRSCPERELAGISEMTIDEGFLCLIPSVEVSSVTNSLSPSGTRFARILSQDANCVEETETHEDIQETIAQPDLEEKKVSFSLDRARAALKVSGRMW